MTLSTSQHLAPFSMLDIDLAALSTSFPAPSGEAAEAYVAVTVLLPVKGPAHRADKYGRPCVLRSPVSRSKEGASMKVLLIDDHPLILSALQAVIQGLGSHVSVVGVATAQAARDRLATDAEFDLVLLDLQLTDADGFDLLSELRAAHPALPVVVVSASDRSTDVIRAIDLGAMGFVPKRATNETLFDALNMVMSGGIYVPPMIMRSHLESKAAAIAPTMRAWGIRRDEGSVWVSGKDGPPLAALGLTPRQTDVLALLSEGQPNKLIARALHLSVETVKDHVAAVLRALNVSSRTQAVLAVTQMSQQGALAAWRESRQSALRRE